MVHLTNPKTTNANSCFDADCLGEPKRVEPCPAKAMKPEQRRDMATRVLAGNQSARQAAREEHVSRKFVSQQTAKAKHALHQAFTPPTETPNDFLFWLPVTKSLVVQMTLGLALTCHSSERGIVRFFRDHFDHPVSVGTVHNTLAGAVDAARVQNAAVDLKGVDIGALDEIFQGRQPVLVGADAASTYCFLLSLEEHRDADTWGVRLLELAERGFAPQATIADFGAGLRAGLDQALPNVPCRGDVFHALMDLNKTLKILENRAYRAIEHRSSLQRKQTRQARRSGRADMSLAMRIGLAKRDEHETLTLADEAKILADWLRRDILAVAGPCHADRHLLYDFVVAELQQRLSLAGDSGKRVGTLLANHRDELLAFVGQLDSDIATLAQQFEVEPDLLRDLLQHQTANSNHPDYWQREAQFHQRAHGRLHELRQAVRELGQQTVRASSVIENLNSRLRGYFFLRRHLGPDYLELLQFYLNHRRFPRSDRPERIGKSPRELLTGQKHPHWLELLGHQRFERN